MENSLESATPAFQPDTDRRDTYAGVGEALSEWEGIEVGLSRIFSIFKGDPDGEPLRTYGEPMFYKARAERFREAAALYFVTHHDQDLEGTLHIILARLEKLSDRRNEIAHGIVMPINAFTFAKRVLPNLEPRTNYWALMPAYYQVRRHQDDGLPAFIYGSADLVRIATSMSVLYGELSEYRNNLNTFTWRENQRRC